MTKANVEHAVMDWTPLVRAPCARHIMGDTAPRGFRIVFCCVPWYSLNGELMNPSSSTSGRVLTLY